ncbi:DUF2203 domain-containing protein [Dictyobacter formicarum]|uniref:DUF2203 domain-containing protein n=1 Tax=Dictyobacter formicarum TaxID=2778368 RepID=A0ABQ3VNH3_9CHLR|nr:DUF2203 domain-containing protein [Dictyobacter formicarum]GHO87794.1 hypothetical protein KSZ_58000 [Dictyobacter formicarum]
MAHYFTREEAEALLPAVLPILKRIQRARQQIQQLEEELMIVQAQAMNNGHHLQQHILQLQEKVILLADILREAVLELQQFDCELKDPDTGLIDFLSLRDGQEVYLCWRLDEERILFWHPIEGGFAGRQPL